MLTRKNLFIVFILAGAMLFAAKTATAGPVYVEDHEEWVQECPKWVWNPNTELIHPDLLEPGDGPTMTEWYEGPGATYHYVYLCHIPRDHLKSVFRQLPDGRWASYMQFKAYPRACWFEPPSTGGPRKWGCDAVGHWVIYPDTTGCVVGDCPIVKEKLIKIHEPEGFSLLNFIYGKARDAVQEEYKGQPLYPRKPVAVIGVRG